MFIKLYTSFMGHLLNLIVLCFPIEVFWMTKDACILEICACEMCEKFAYKLLKTIESSFFSFRKKLPPGHLIIIRDCGSKYCWKGFTLCKENIQFTRSLEFRISVSRGCINFTRILFSIIWNSRCWYLKDGLYDHT